METEVSAFMITTLCDSCQVKFYKSNSKSGTAYKPLLWILKDSSKGVELLLEKCVRNNLIWQKICSHFSTHFLLSSCSLVSRDWNTQVRRFIQDYRVCTAQHPVDTTEWWQLTPCEFLQEFNQLCGRVTGDGRIIPWNQIKMDFPDTLLDEKTCADDPINEVQLENLMVSSFKLKRLHISFPFEEKGNCIIHEPFMSLLSHKGPELQTLVIDSLSAPFNELLSRWQPDLTSLVEVELPLLNIDESERPPVRNCLERLLEAAPRLRRIIPAGQSTLEIIPEAKYGLLLKLQIAYVRPQDEILWEKIMNASPKVTELSICTLFSIRTWDPNDNSVFGARLRQEQETSLAVIQQLLQTCCRRIAHLNIDGLHPLSPFSFPPLLSLSRLSLTMNNLYGGMERFWGSIAAIEFDRHMPNLEEIEISLTMRARNRRQYKIECGGMTEWPPAQNSVFWGVSSVRKLTLELQVRTINVPLVRIVFPNVTRLELIVNDSKMSRADLAPFTAIWEAWPELTGLVVTGWRNNLLTRSYDADFLGIHEEEVELLTEKDDDYLRAVHLVPIKPSILGMQNLRFLRIDVKFCNAFGGWSHSDYPTEVISRLTKIVAFRRMARAEIFVAPVFKALETDELEFDTHRLGNRYLFGEDSSDEDDHSELPPDELEQGEGNDEDFVVNYDHDVDYWNDSR